MIRYTEVLTTRQASLHFQLSTITRQDNVTLEQCNFVQSTKAQFVCGYSTCICGGIHTCSTRPRIAFELGDCFTWHRDSKVMPTQSLHSHVNIHQLHVLLLIEFMLGKIVLLGSETNCMWPTKLRAQAGRMGKKTQYLHSLGIRGSCSFLYHQSDKYEKRQE